MSVNKYLLYVYVIPEDDANRQLATGFQLDPQLDERRMQILEAAGGWTNVLHRFKEEQLSEMDRYVNRHVILLIDFDGREDRLHTVIAGIPERLRERVFVLGTWSEPEELRETLGTYETIGRALAKDCHDNTEATWAHNLLRHNAGELERLRKHIRPILFK